MSTGQLIHEDYIILGLKAENREAVMQLLYQKLYDAGKVKDSFWKGVIEREKIFPTGLRIGNYGIAIPHTEPQYVKEEGIAIAVLKTPVCFEAMDCPDDMVKADIVFMLALGDGHNHIELISRIVKMFQNQDVLENLRTAGTKKEVAAIVRKNM